MGKLNSAKLRTLTKPGVYSDGGGLYLQVRNADHRTWVYRFTLHGRPRWMGLGAFSDVSLAEARESAAGARKLVRQGLDPIEARRSQQASNAGLKDVQRRRECLYRRPRDKLAQCQAPAAMA
ncbi:MAG TPA: Arm DNA-binding domain-containing protein [Acetobacteraceae bacterium]|nr:Arm DNA-binding domain-containing protein [Acetobacteraceae bacterium]